MNWVKTVWAFIVDVSSKLWEGIKKLPGWGVVAILTVIALVVYLIKKNALLKRRSEVLEDLANIEIEHNDAVNQAESDHSVKVKILSDRKFAAMDELKIIDEEISEAAEQGPIGLANAWKEHLAEGE